MSVDAVALKKKNFFFLTGEECSRSSFELLATVGLSPCLRVQSYNVFFIPPNLLAKKIPPRQDHRTIGQNSMTLIYGQNQKRPSGFLRNVMPCQDKIT